MPLLMATYEGGRAIKSPSQYGVGFAKAALFLRGEKTFPCREAQKEVGPGNTRNDENILRFVPGCFSAGSQCPL